MRELITHELLAGPELTDMEVAVLVYGKATEADIVTLITREVEQVRRAVTRDVERAAFATVLDRYQGQIATAESIARAPMDAAFGVLFRRTFRLGDGKVVEWGRATIEQHEQRIALLTSIRDGIDDTIEQHRWAIEQIRIAGATCLADVEPLNV